MLGVEADGILDKEFVNKKEGEDVVLEQLNAEHNFDDIKDAFDEGTVPHQVECFYGGDNVEFKNPDENSIEKKPEIIDTVESNYRVIRRVYQHMYSDIADIFFEYVHSYVHSYDLDEIQELDEEMKANEWGI